MPDRSCRRGFARYDVEDPDDLIALVRSGAIWKTPFIQQGIDLIESGRVKVTECRNLPAWLTDSTGWVTR